MISGNISIWGININSSISIIAVSARLVGGWSVDTKENLLAVCYSRPGRKDAWAEGAF
jgi:hypothetical protein